MRNQFAKRLLNIFSTWHQFYPITEIQGRIVETNFIHDTLAPGWFGINRKRKNNFAVFCNKEFIHSPFSFRLYVWKFEIFQRLLMKRDVSFLDSKHERQRLRLWMNAPKTSKSYLSKILEEICYLLTSWPWWGRGRYWSVSNRVSVQFLGINMQEIMEIRDLSPPGSQKSCKFNQQISSMKKWKRRKKFFHCLAWHIL